MITATSMLIGFGNIVDTADVDGGLKIAAGVSKMMNPDNLYLPIFDASAGCYRFYEYKVETRGILQNSADKVSVYLRVTFAKRNAYVLMTDAANSGLTLSLQLKWTGSLGTVNYNFTDATVSGYVNSLLSAPTNSLILGLTGISSLASGAEISAIARLSSELGVMQNGANKVHQVSAAM